MSEQTELLREMRDLLKVIAEPALAKRGEGLRVILRELIGRSKPNAKAVLLMDGTRTRKAIRHETGVDQGNFSRLEKSLREKKIVNRR